MLQRGQTLFWVLATVLVVLMLVTLRQLPPVVASHFDLAGVPNGWSGRPLYAVMVIAMGVLLPLGVAGLVVALTRSGLGRLNIPARDPWTRPEHRAEAVRRVRTYIWWLSCILAGTVLLMHLLVLAAHTHQPPRLSNSAVLVVLGAVVLGVAGWTAGWYRLLRPPPAG